MAPDQEIYDAVYAALLAAGIKPYDTRPDLTTAKMPLVYIGDTHQVDDPTKTGISARVSITLGVWGTSEQRYEVAQLTARLFDCLRKVKRTEHQNVVLMFDQTTRDVSEYKTDALDLWSGLLDVTYKSV